jgi:hypothetical protein
MAPLCSVQAATTYYFDNNAGSDTNSCTDKTTPCKSFDKINSLAYMPGDTILFKRGSVWSTQTKGLIISRPGNTAAPIIFGAYGEGTVKPVLENPSGSNGQKTDVVTIKSSASYVIIKDLLLQNSFNAGVMVQDGANHITVSDSEITGVGVGIMTFGQNNIFTRNYIHDLHLIVNTEGGDDDYGAVGIEIYNDNNEISYNRLENLEAPSYDYGLDGGAIEIYQHGDNSYIHHNWSRNSEGFMEISADPNQAASANGIVVAYNIIINSRDLTAFHATGDKFAMPTDDLRFENNTFVDTRAYPEPPCIIWVGGTPTAGALKMRNNIFYLGSYGSILAASNMSFTWTHSNNLFYYVTPLAQGSWYPYHMDTTEKTADPLFVNVGAADFHLSPGSLAVNNGMNLGYSSDFDSKTVPEGSAPDIGVFEYRDSGGTPLPKSGDANSDGTVNEVDYINYWLPSYHQSVTGILKGDFNGDNFNDGVDYVIWLNNFGN